MLLILFGCLPEVELGPQKRACAVTFVYVVAVETYGRKNANVKTSSERSMISYIFVRNISYSVLLQNKVIFQRKYIFILTETSF